MKLHILSSSSQGNSYVISSDTSALVIEAGVSVKRVKKALDFNVNKVKGCLISHSHGDHSKYINDFLSAGINCYMSQDTYNELNITSHKLPYILEPNISYTLGDFKIFAFPVKHDVPCFGFLFKHEECGKVLFLTDTAYTPYKATGLNQILIECNYDIDILNENVLSGKIHPIVRERVLRSHMSIETCKDALKANDLSRVNNIILIHLSDSNSNAEDFQKQVFLQTGKTITVADKDITIDFNITPF